MHTSRTGQANRTLPEMELLRPQRPNGRRAASRAPSEVVDAVFETVVPEVELDEGEFGAPEGLFIPHVKLDGNTRTQYRPMSTEPAGAGGRLDVFSAKAMPFVAQQARHSPMAGPVFLTGVVAVAAALFWMAGGHAYLDVRNSGPDGMITATVPAKSPAPVQSKSPFGDQGMAGEGAQVSGVPNTTAELAASEPVAEKTKAPPARIERAGSILMIRSGS